MEDGLLLVSVSVADGTESAYHAWHQLHVREIVAAVPTIVGARRYEVASPEAGDALRFLAVYQVAGGDVAGAREDLRRAGEAGHVSPPPDGVVTGAATVPYVAVDVEERRG